MKTDQDVPERTPLQLINACIHLIEVYVDGSGPDDPTPYLDAGLGSVYKLLRLSKEQLTTGEKHDSNIG